MGAAWQVRRRGARSHLEAGCLGDGGAGVSTDVLEGVARAASNGHSPLTGDHPFAEAFDAVEVAWVYEVTVFDLSQPFY